MFPGFVPKNKSVVIIFGCIMFLFLANGNIINRLGTTLDKKNGIFFLLPSVEEKVGNLEIMGKICIFGGISLQIKTVGKSVGVEKSKCMDDA